MIGMGATVPDTHMPIYISVCSGIFKMKVMEEHTLLY